MINIVSNNTNLKEISTERNFYIYSVINLAKTYPDQNRLIKNSFLVGGEYFSNHM